jgi:hypothetical protein
MIFEILRTAAHTPCVCLRRKLTIASSQSNYRTKITIDANKVEDISAGNTSLKLSRKPPLKNGMQCAFFSNLT